MSRCHRLATQRFIERNELLSDPVVTWTGNTPAERACWLGTEGGEDPIIARPQVNDGGKLIAYVRAWALLWPSAKAVTWTTEGYRRMSSR